MSNFANSAQLKELAGYMGGLISVPQVVQNFTAENIYSEDERMIGRWIDGKPLYQKVIRYEFTSAIDGTVTPIEIPLGEDFTNKNIVDNRLTTSYSDPGLYPHKDRTAMATIICKKDTDNLLYLRSSDKFVSGDTVHAILKYTKSTDTASDYHMASPYEFSTNETLIGTWIDGSPVYQKTFTGLNIPITWVQQYDVVSNNYIDSVFPTIDLDKVIRAEGRTLDSSGITAFNAPMSIISSSTNRSDHSLVVFAMVAITGSEYVDRVTLQYLK